MGKTCLKSNWLTLVSCLAFSLFTTNALFAAGIPGLGSAMKNQDIDASADKLDFVGDNIIATGHVVVRFKDIHISADKAVINMTTKDIDASGRVRFIQRTTEETKLDYQEYKRLLKDPNTKVTVNGHYMDPTGRQMLRVTIVKEINSWTGEHAVGNLATGNIDLGKFYGRYDKYYVIGKHAERFPRGKILVRDAKVTTCEYVMDRHEHYSITASSVELLPQYTGRTQRYYADKGHYHMFVWNAVLRVGDVPIFYFPFLYKPPDDSTGLGIQVKGGKDSDWGYFVLTKKSFHVLDYPNTKVTLMADYYSKRGPGGGVAINSRTATSNTDFSIYGVYDKEYKNYRKGRFDYHQNRYEIYASHVQHITPRLDLRAQLDVLSDQEFLHDFFRNKEDANPQPATFVALEYQFDRLSAGAIIRPRVNDFFSVVESLPEVRLDIPRQELFANIYYQGETTFNYRRMNWRHYDHPRSSGGQDIKRYESARFDTLHMFYYPFKLAMFNFIPRAGIRLTAYSRTSKKRVSDEDINNYFIVDSPTVDNAGSINNYDSRGGSEVRFAGELGMEVNTKIYRTWQTAKSAFWGVDGLRHVIVPYMNYNYIPEPTLDRERIYYFDDIDRIREQNFLRVGVKNRLETRRGDYGDQEVYTWASLEHYMDFHFESEKNFDTVGDFGTILKFNPTPNFSSAMDLLCDVGKGRLNRFDFRIDYDINEDWKVFMGYYYQREYEQRSVYSMGSSLTDITSGSAFSRYYEESQSIYGGVNFPIFDKTRCEVSAYYDIFRNNFNEGRIRLVRQLHCWEVGVEYRARQRNDDMGEEDWEHSLMFTLTLAALPSVKISAKQSASTGGGANN